ncbi:type IV pilus assembly protein PilC [Actinokineospora alba]|uniref:Type IV pilus assembly protein PilC n=1 Tax=Actinokineospora alba TaxID=504798 RepID=A0A1H0ETL5_9PSEU|nr:type II secretion system F family protein [Actinokineospora alba]TDP69219.1 type IV pilus assembly protein PilC [Actinokineospora alba]SDI21648.1 type IV pilus assembly protein PilC [Actinokineospora alba]SDN85663.1 type IV pilus assembly protein PilC [Actinokineospora alba]
MAKFAYSATRPDGSPTTGTHKADTREAAELALYEQELRDIQVVEKTSVLKRELTAPRVKREEVMHLSRQLGAFIKAGLPLIDAVRTLGEEADNSSVRKMMREVEDGLRRGEKLSDCFDRHPKIFPEFYRGILRSAELSGKLDSVLDRLARYLERDLEAKRKIKAALIYPAMIAGMSLITVIVLASFVLPRFKVFFDSLDATLPLPTRMLLAVTDFLTEWWWALGAGFVLLALIIFGVVRTTRGRYARDKLFLSLPVLGSTIQYALVERFSRILSSMVSAGVPLPEALRVATESLRNRVFIGALSRVGEALLEGEGLAKPIAATGLFPTTAGQMIRVGEETGTLDAQLEVTAQYYEGELDYKLKKLTALFEPAVIVVMGVVVGFVAVALVSAMYGIFNQVS